MRGQHTMTVTAVLSCDVPNDFSLRCFPFSVRQNCICNTAGMLRARYVLLHDILERFTVLLSL